MGLFDWVKGRLLGIPDALNRRLHPFEEFNRSAYIIDDKPLKDKGDLFWKDMERFRFGPIGEFYANAIPSDGGDHAFFQGQHTATAVLRKDKGYVTRSLAGQERLQTLGGDNRMARGADFEGGPMKVGDPNRRYFKDDGYIYHQNCSESSLIGQVWGLFCVIKFDPGSAHQSLAVAMISSLADQLIKDDYRMLDQDGKPAKFGDLRPRFKTAPIRLGALAVTLLLAYEATRDRKYLARYKDIVSSNMGALTHQETHVLWVHPYYQDILAYYNYTMLAVLDRFGNRSKWISALGHLWQRTNHDGNSLYAYLAKLAGVKVKDEYIDQAEKTLSEFNTDQSNGPTGKSAGPTKYEEPYPSFIINPRRWGPRFLRGGRKVLSSQPVPPAFRPSADFFWQRDPRTLNGHADHEYNALDFCLAEALGRYLGDL